MSQTLRQRKALQKRLERQGRLLGRKSKLPFEDKVAYFGMVIVQGALLPSHFNGVFPHWSLPTMLVCGLCCYQYRAYVQRDMVYTIGNMTGIFLNGSMLFRMFVIGG